MKKILLESTISCKSFRMSKSNFFLVKKYQYIPKLILKLIESLRVRLLKNKKGINHLFYLNALVLYALSVAFRRLCIFCLKYAIAGNIKNSSKDKIMLFLIRCRIFKGFSMSNKNKCLKNIRFDNKTSIFHFQM